MSCNRFAVQFLLGIEKVACSWELKISFWKCYQVQYRNRSTKLCLHASSLFSKVMKKLCMEPPDRLTSLQTLWENNKPAEPGPCGINLWLWLCFNSTSHCCNHVRCVCIVILICILFVLFLLCRWVFSDVQMCLWLAGVALQRRSAVGLYFWILFCSCTAPGSVLWTGWHKTTYSLLVKRIATTLYG